MINVKIRSESQQLLLLLLVFLGSAVAAGSMLDSLAYGPAKKAQAVQRASADAENQIFLANLRARVLNNWLLADGHNIVVLECTVNPSGEVLHTQTSASKADALSIEAAQGAFEKSQPLGHLPLKYHGDCKITLIFTSHVDPHGDSTSHLTSRIEEIEPNSKCGTAVGTTGEQAPNHEEQSMDSSRAK